jgi:hypothetical protein
MLQACIVYNKSNTYGLSKDAALLSEVLPSVGRISVKLLDSREPPVVCDICIHLEVPYAVWFPWAKVNVMMVNSEWWLNDKWSGYWDNFDIGVFRDSASLERLTSGSFGAPRHSMVVPWVSKTKGSPKLGEGSTNHQDGFLWVLGGSPNKRAAAEQILGLWKESYPRLTVCSLEPLSNQTYATNVVVKTGFLKQDEIDAMALAHPGHICISRAESFGYTAAEAEATAAFTLLNTIPVYTETYTNTPGVGWLTTAVDSQGFAIFPDADVLLRYLDTAIADFYETDLAASRKARKAISSSRKEKFTQSLGEMLKECVEAAAANRRGPLPQYMPPLLHQKDCPPISVITLVHGRPKFIENAFLNLLSSDYPRDKIEWVVVDDSNPEDSASDKIVQFGQKFSPGLLTYVPLARQRSVGFKRNLGCERAKHDVLVMMDDDDHYPSTSFRRRVAYLLKARERYECAVCTTIAMYDLLKGISAVNVPPYTLSLGERCSEATLTFTRRFWEQRKFEDTNMAEGERFLSGREAFVAELPPQQMIVALSHGKNLSGRKMPDANPGCFWGFPQQLLEFLHGLVGISVEAA